MTITGDGRRLLDTFITYALQANTCGDLADAMYYELDEMQRRARDLSRQLDELDKNNE